MVIDGMEDFNDGRIAYLFGDAASGQVWPAHARSKSEDDFLVHLKTRFRYVER